MGNVAGNHGFYHMDVSCKFSHQPILGQMKNWGILSMIFYLLQDDMTEKRSRFFQPEKISKPPVSTTESNPAQQISLQKKTNARFETPMNPINYQKLTLLINKKITNRYKPYTLHLIHHLKRTSKMFNHRESDLVPSKC